MHGPRSVIARRISSAALLFVVMLAWSSTGGAHHIVSQYGIAPAEPVTRASLQLEMREFNFDGGPAGLAQIATPRLQYAPLAWLSGTVRLPVAAVQYDTATNAVGIGDLAIGATARLYATEHGELIVSAGLGSEFPTGRVDDGLGAGHFELAPFVVVSSSPTDNVVIFGSFTDQFAPSSFSGGSDSGEDDSHSHSHSHDHHHGDGAVDPSGVHGSVIAPHADHEFRARIGGAYVVDPFYVSVSNSLVYAWSRETSFGPNTVSAEFGWRPVDSLRFALGADLPVVGPDRYLWSAQLATSWSF